MPASSVLIIVENLAVPFDRRVWMEATTLRQSGHDVTVICPTNAMFPKSEEVIEGVRIFRHPLPEAGTLLGYLREYCGALFWEYRLARRAWRGRAFDVVHICNPPDLLFIIAGIYKALYGCAVVFDQHDINPEVFEDKYGKRGVLYFFLRLLERTTFAVADVVISTNESYRQIALSRGGQKKDDVFVVRSAPDLARFERTSGNKRFKRGRQFAVGYVGVMGQQEGIDGLLRCVHHIVVDLGRTDIHFMIIGDGPVRRQLEELSARLGIEKFVEFPGRVSDHELLERLSTCEVCVNPDPKTPFNDKSTMNKVLEYMALGKPIVQYDLTEGRRSAGEASLYAIPGDEGDFAEKILAILDDETLATHLGDVGLTRMRASLGWSHQAPSLLAAHEAAAARARRSSVRGNRLRARPSVRLAGRALRTDDPDTGADT